MFTTENEVIPERFRSDIRQVEDNYQIAVNDYIKIEVYTNRGERIIDPDFELFGDLQPNSQNLRPDPTYPVFGDGFVDLPIIGRLALEGLTLDEAKVLLEKEYSKYYKDPYVIINYTNKRVIVLGGTNGGQVVPLLNERMTLLEVLAVAGGVDNNSRANNIRLIRGDLNDPLVMVIDLTTIAGMKKSNLLVEPDDVIYLEPIRRPVAESTRDYLPVVTALTSLLTLILVIQQL
jgi:polysaccharide export outer membrane protein